MAVQSFLKSIYLRFVSPTVRIINVEILIMKVLMWLIILVIVVVGGYWFFINPTGPEIVPVGAGTQNDARPIETGSAQQQTGTSGVVSTPVAPTIIAYTSDGFSPANVTIKKGETVRFINNDSRQETWPASAVHPTHAVYPQKSSTDCLGSSFDACRGLKPGESWDFTFDVVGAWGFHDHLHPSKWGKITVTQ